MKPGSQRVPGDDEGEERERVFGEDRPQLETTRVIAPVRAVNVEVPGGAQRFPACDVDCASSCDGTPHDIECHRILPTLLLPKRAQRALYTDFLSLVRAFASVFPSHLYSEEVGIVSGLYPRCALPD